MLRSVLRGFIAVTLAASSVTLAQDRRTLLERLADNGVEFSGTSLVSDAVIDVGDSQDLHLWADGGLEVRDRESGNLLLSGILTITEVDDWFVKAKLVNGTHRFEVRLEASDFTNTGVTVEGSVVSRGVRHMLAPLWIEDTADNASLLLAQDPVPVPIPPVEPPRRGKYACICGWTKPDGTTGYRIGCAKADCNIQTTCSSTGTVPTGPSSSPAPTDTATGSPVDGDMRAVTTALRTQAAIEGRCMWVDSSDPNGAEAPVVLIGVLTAGTLAGFAGIAAVRRRRNRGRACA